MRVRVASCHYCHHFPASEQRELGVPLCFLPLSCQGSSLTVSGQELASGTVDCAQVWLARAGESIGLWRECHQGAGDGGGDTHRGPGCYRCRHIPPASPSKGDAHQTPGLRPRLLPLRARTSPPPDPPHPHRVRRQLQDARARPHVSTQTHTHRPLGCTGGCKTAPRANSR